MKLFDGLALGQFDTLKSQTQHEMMIHSQQAVVIRSDLREVVRVKIIKFDNVNKPVICIM